MKTEDEYLQEEIEAQESGMLTPPQPKESIVMCFRNGCVAAYVEQDDGTYKVVINGEMYPRHLRLINQVIELFKEFSKEDRPAKTEKIYCDVGDCHALAVPGSTKCRYHGGKARRIRRPDVTDDDPVGYRKGE